MDNDYVDSVLLFDVFDEILACDKELRAAEAESAMEGAELVAKAALAADSPHEWF